MSFYSINDRDERDKMIAEYLETKERIKNRNIQARMQNIEEKSSLEREYEPILKGQQKIFY